MYSYGSGCAASMFTIRVKGDYSAIRLTSNFNMRLNERIKKTPAEYDEAIVARTSKIGECDYTPSDPVEELFPGVYYLEGVDKMYRRVYKRKPLNKEESINMKTPTICIRPTKSKVFALSKL